MKIAVTGASGFIGSSVCRAAKGRGHEVVPLGRSVWDPMSGPAPLGGVDAVIHLAGEPIAKGRWTRAKMGRIRQSRVVGTRNLVAGLKGSSVKVLVSGSAIGWYGDRGDEVLTEGSPRGTGFLAEVARDWEEEARRAAVRTVILRTGIALGAGGGALARMLLPFKLGLGGRLAGGGQWMSWIHVDDLAGLFLFAVEKEALSGPLLGTAPNPVTNLGFTKTLGRVLGRPTILPMPYFQMRLLFGKVAEVLAGSQRCSPKRTLEAGFTFVHPTLEPALRAILGA